MFGVLAWSVCRPQGDAGHLLEENKEHGEGIQGVGELRPWEAKVRQLL